MKWINQNFGGLAVLMVGALSVVDAFADAKINPYETIVDRNPFGLKPAPPPVDAPPPGPPPAPPATVELTGIISSLIGKKRALLEITPGPGKPVQRPVLVEGERVESVEVISINVEKNEVTIKNGTLTTNLALKVSKPAPGGVQVASVPQPNQLGVPFTPANNLGVPGAAAPTVFTPGTAGGNLGSGRGNAVVFGATSTGAPGGGGAVATFGAQPTTPTFGGATTTGAGGAYGGVTAATPGASGDFKAIPPRTPRAPQPPQPQAPGQHVDPAVQYINLKVQEQTFRQQGRAFPPVPPIPGLE